jgi:hypothetical protein
MIASKKGEMMDPVRQLLRLTFMSCDLRLLILYHQHCVCLVTGKQRPIQTNLIIKSWRKMSFTYKERDTLILRPNAPFVVENYISFLCLCVPWEIATEKPEHQYHLFVYSQWYSIVKKKKIVALHFTFRVLNGCCIFFFYYQNLLIVKTEGNHWLLLE